MSTKQASIKAAIIAEIERFAAEEEKELPPLTEDLPLLDLAGLDSLALAILVARLDTELGLDPFTDSDNIFYPVTLGDFIRAYEKADETR
jgi:acyl carrier protein